MGKLCTKAALTRLPPGMLNCNRLCSADSILLRETMARKDAFEKNSKGLKRAREQLLEGRVTGEIGAQDKVVHKEADEAFEFTSISSRAR